MWLSACKQRTYKESRSTPRFILTYREKYDIMYITIEKQTTNNGDSNETNNRKRV